MSKVIITGTSSGFGKLAAQQLRKNDHQVVATMRDTEGRNKKVSTELRALGCSLIEMDVTHDASVNNAIEAAVDQMQGIDVVVNMAGQGCVGLQESFTPDDWKKIFDINVFGVQRVCRATLPHFKAKKSGLIINVSSLLGRITVPFNGPYNASKWALESLSESYRSELSQLGIEVCIVEPGGFPTAFNDKLLRPSDSSRNASYGEMANAAETSVKGYEKAYAANPAQDPKIVAETIVALIQSEYGKRPFRTIVDKMGMSGPISAYNEQLSQITAEIYGAFGMGHLLSVKVG